MHKHKLIKCSSCHLIIAKCRSILKTDQITYMICADCKIINPQGEKMEQITQEQAVKLMTKLRGTGRTWRVGKKVLHEEDLALWFMTQEGGNFVVSQLVETPFVL